MEYFAFKQSKSKKVGKITIYKYKNILQRQ